MSTKLSCSAGKCVHNINGLCSAKDIKVTGFKAKSSSETQCEAFSERSFKNAFVNLANMNVTGEVKQLFTKDSIEMNPKVLCNVENCVHNKDNICSANNVQINGLKATRDIETQCETFVQR